MPASIRLVLLAALVASGCAAIPVSVDHADPREVHREITRNVLTSGRPSDRSLQALERLGLRKRFDEDPAETLAILHAGLAPTGDQRRLFALAELSFYHADRTRDVRYYGAAAVYAYALLFPNPGEELLDPSDPRVRLAYDLYNRGITEALARDASGHIVLRGGRFQLPFGSIDVDSDEGEFDWGVHRLTGFVAAADLEVHGLRNRYRRSGIGAPLCAEVVPTHESAPAERFMPGLRVPTTLLIRIEDPRRGIARGHLRARAEIYTPDEAQTVSIAGRDVPVEFETTSSLAASLADSPLWDFELKGFFSGAFRPLAKIVEEAVAGQAPVEPEAETEGLLFVTPWRPGHIPIVLIHGTASSPARWADLVNELSNERDLWQRYQVWLFLYNTGNPIGYSAGLLRRSLERAVQRLDPEGTDPQLREMVLIGHSQGGLLAKLMAVDSGTRFWDRISRVPIEQLELSPPVRETLELGTFFQPQPFVSRVIFVCTPQRGSYLASVSFARVVSDLISLPSNLTVVVSELLLQNPDDMLMRGVARLPTSIDNMTPGNPFIQTLASLPIAPRIHAHSIIAVLGDGPPGHGSDGVVRYRSAHLDDVESELVVRSGHSAQAQPEVIEEIKRILREHSAQVP